LTQGYTDMLVSGLIEGAVFTLVSRKYKQLASGKMTPFLSNDETVLLVETIAVCFWLVLMAAYYQHAEGWTFTDAMYFSFVSISTIGEFFLLILFLLLIECTTQLCPCT
jgi:hypothetical protein